MKKLVILGVGMASGRALEELFAASPDACEVTLFGAESRGNCNRIMLSPVLSGEQTFEEIATHDAGRYDRHGRHLPLRRGRHRHRPRPQDGDHRNRRDAP